MPRGRAPPIRGGGSCNAVRSTLFELGRRKVPSRILRLCLGAASVLALFWLFMTTVQRRPVQKALTDAVKRGDMSMVQLLLQRGADPNTRDDAEIPLATWALVEDHPEIAEVLMKRGARVDSRFCMLDATGKGKPTGAGPPGSRGQSQRAGRAGADASPGLLRPARPGGRQGAASPGAAPNVRDADGATRCCTR